MHVFLPSREIKRQKVINPILNKSPISKNGRAKINNFDDGDNGV